MPEGDSYRRAAERLQPLVGEVVAASSPSARGRATGVAEQVDGRVLLGVEAIGKHLLLDFDGGRRVRSRLGMNGRWRVLSPDAPVPPSAWLVLRTSVATAVQLGGPVLALDSPGRRPRLGPDVLSDDAEPASLVARLRLADPQTPLAVALQDQRLVAGVGNMWAAEALWATALHPLLPVGAATDDELRAVLDWARDAMRAAVGGGRARRAVHRRAGRPCPRCGAPVTASGVGEHNRTAYRCDACQRRA